MKHATVPLEPTFQGFVQDTTDALVLFEAHLRGMIHGVKQRPSGTERSQLARSGYVFIYDGNESGIKRWTDDVAWSHSRVLGDFRIYRELKEPFPGSRKCANKRKRSINAGEGGLRHGNHDSQLNSTTAASFNLSKLPTRTTIEFSLPSVEQDKELDRSLVGSLVDSYGFREDGLVKKTMSIKIEDITHHMISYYQVSDVKGKRLARPTLSQQFAPIKIRAELYLKQNFRSHVAGVENYAAHHGPNFELPPMIHGYQQISPGHHTCDTRSSAVNIPTATTSGGLAVTYPQFDVAISSAAFHGPGPQFAASYENGYVTTQGMICDISCCANDVMDASTNVTCEPVLRIPWLSPLAVAGTVHSAHASTSPPFMRVGSPYTTTQSARHNNQASTSLADVQRKIPLSSFNVKKHSNHNTNIQQGLVNGTSVTNPDRFSSLPIEYDDRSETAYTLGDTTTPSSTSPCFRALLSPYQH
jgi:hypothetical protein